VIGLYNLISEYSFQREKQTILIPTIALTKPLNAQNDSL
jgi:hypothetical protein